MRSIASRPFCLRRTRSTTSRIDSAMTALLFRPSNVSLKAALTSSGTLKLTVAMILVLDC